jgi:hypothetical protein
LNTNNWSNKKGPVHQRTILWLLGPVCLFEAKPIPLLVQVCSNSISIAYILFISPIVIFVNLLYKSKVDSYRHTFHSKLYTKCKDNRLGEQEKERIIGRAEAAYRILKVFSSKLVQKWKRKPTYTPWMEGQPMRGL